jgi:hypothetical protein
LPNKPLYEFLTSLLEDKIAIIFHFLADIVDGIGIQLIQLAKLSEPALDDEGQSEQQMLSFLRIGKFNHTVNELLEQESVGIHVFQEILLLISDSVCYCVNFQDLVKILHEI